MISEIDQSVWRELMVKAQAGDAQAYNSLLEAIVPVIRAFINRRIHFLGLTEEIVQETLLAIHKGRHTYLPSQEFTPWMYAIARYKMIDFLRHHNRTKVNEVSFDVDQESKLIDDGRDGESQFAMGNELAELLSHLDSDSATIIKMTKLDEMSVGEVALKLGISESNVKVRVHRAMKFLRALMLKRVAHEDHS